MGKSTLLLQAAAHLADRGQRVLYASGEESPAQIRMRGDRLGIDSAELLVASQTDVSQLIEQSRSVTPRVLIVDSIQAMRVPDLAAIPGSPTQVRESANRLVDYAKTSGTTLILVGHVTKDGALAGPRTLEHLVDTVVQFDGERHQSHRILRALKNRFGPTDELAVFEMVETGMREVANPSRLFLSATRQEVPGSAVLAAVEGSRPLLVEIQALVGENSPASPRRTTLGVDSGRVAMILAVLQRRAGLDLAQRDVFVNVAGGLEVDEPAADLAVAAAIASSLTGRAIPERRLVFGEIGLTGEIRPVGRSSLRLREAAKLGYREAVVPAETESVDGLTLKPASTIERALEQLLGRARPASLRSGSRRPFDRASASDVPTDS